MKNQIKIMSQGGDVIGSVFGEECPASRLVLPRGWVVTEPDEPRGMEPCIARINQSSGTPHIVIPHPICIVSRTVVLPGGESEPGILSAATENALGVWWRRGGVAKVLLVGQQVLATEGAIVRLARYGCGVTSLNAANVIQYLADFENANLCDLPHPESRATRSG